MKPGHFKTLGLDSRWYTFEELTPEADSVVVAICIDTWSAGVFTFDGEYLVDGCGLIPAKNYKMWCYAP